MAGTTPVAGNLSIEDLAATLTSHEQLAFEQVTGLTVDPTRPRNLVTTVAQVHQLGPLALCPSGEPAHGTRILSTTVYILGAKAAVDLLRLPLAAAESAEDLEAGFDPDLDVHRTHPARRTPPPQETSTDREPKALTPDDQTPSSRDNLRTSPQAESHPVPGSEPRPTPEPKPEDIEADPSPS